MRSRGGKDVSFAQRAAKIACLRLKKLTKFNSFFLRATRCSGNGIFKWLRAVSVNREVLAPFMAAVACNARTNIVRAEFSPVRARGAGASRLLVFGCWVAVRIRVSWCRCRTRAEANRERWLECVAERQNAV